MGDGVDETELAPSESGTASVWAWGLDDEDEPAPVRFSAGRIVAAAVAASLLAVTVAGAMAWQHLRSDEEPVPTAATMVQATVAPTTTITAKPPPPLPPPPPVTITTVVVQAPPSALPDNGITPEAVAAYDEQFISTMTDHGFTSNNHTATAHAAHQVCAMIQKGAAPDSVQTWVAAESEMGMSFALMFVSTAMLTYPNCP